MLKRTIGGEGSITNCCSCFSNSVGFSLLYQNYLCSSFNCILRVVKSLKFRVLCLVFASSDAIFPIHFEVFLHQLYSLTITKCAHIVVKHLTLGQNEHPSHSHSNARSHLPQSFLNKISSTAAKPLFETQNFQNGRIFL